MNDFTLSRRNFFLRTLGLAASGLGTASLKPGQVLERIKANVGIPWRTQTMVRCAFWVIRNCRSGAHWRFGAIAAFSRRALHLTI
jgi:hypothetical protein